ncbi:MAG: PEGA domain-containing protein [Phycisphaeraceae bacterium]|nr:PEGA domain-containing protein [Phycisphaerae bacterium]MBX3391597.1 PEGA domain-containing protein [Phycisphaeraceae bacterium]
MRPLLVILAAATAFSSGCLQRRLLITSDPPGAIVYANDVELGRTPIEANFTFYGGYDVRVELEGYEPLRTRAQANAPFYEIPPFDLVAMAVPFDIQTTIRWHFALTQAVENVENARVVEDALLDRAKDLRTRLGDPPASTPDSTSNSPQGSPPAQNLPPN